MNQTAPTRMHPIDSAVQMLPLPAGQYAIGLAGARHVRHVAGLTLPSMQITGLGAAGNAAVTVFGEGSSAVGWLRHAGDVVVVRVPEGGGQVLMTTYRARGDDESGLRVSVQKLGPGQAAAASPPQTVSAPPSRPARPAPAPAPAPAHNRDMLPRLFTLQVHVQNHGDLTADAGSWAAARDPQRRQVEGFTILPQHPNLPADAIAYKAVLVDGRESPWVAQGSYCGTKGRALGLTGIAFRLSPRLARQFTIEYQVIGRRTGEVGPRRDGEPLTLPAGDVICAIRVQMTRRPAPGAMADAATDLSRSAWL